MYGYVVNKDLGLLVLKFAGEVSLQQIGELLQEVRNDPDYSPTLNVLSDSRELTSSYSYEELHAFAQQLPPPVDNSNQAKSATLAGKDITFGMGRVWEAIAEYKKHRSESRVFRKLEKALEWLGLPDDTKIKFPF